MQTLSTPKSQHSLLNDHIIKMVVNEGEVVEAADILEMHKLHLTLTGGKPFVILLDARKHFTVTAEARTLLASDEFIKHHLPSAFLVRSLAAKLTGNFLFASISQKILQNFFRMNQRQWNGWRIFGRN